MLESLVRVRWVVERGLRPPFFMPTESTIQSIDDAIVPDIEADGGTVTEDRAAVVTHLAVLRVDMHCWG